MSVQKATEIPVEETQSTGLDRWQVAVIIIGVITLVTLILAIVATLFPMPTPLSSGTQTISGGSSVAPTYVFQTATTIPVAFTNNANPTVLFTTNVEILQTGNIVLLTIVGSTGVTNPAPGGGVMTTDSGVIPAQLCPKSDTVFCIVAKSGGLENALTQLTVFQNGALQFSNYTTSTLFSPNYVPLYVSMAVGDLGITVDTNVSYSLL